MTSQRFAVFRIETRDELPGGDLGAHIRGETRPETAYTRQGLPPWVMLTRDDGASGEMRCRLSARPPGGKPPAKCLDVVVDLRVSCDEIVPDEQEPTHEQLKEMVSGTRPWTLGAVTMWGKDVLEWIRDEVIPDARIACACIHLDEKSVHIHIEIAPIVKTPDGDIRLGNAPVREAFARRATEFKAANDKAKRARKRELDRKGRPFRKERSGMYVNFKTAMSLAQDAYHEKFGQAFGLKRGLRGSKRVHEAIDRTKGLEAKIEAMEREEHQMRARKEQLQRELEQVNPGGIVDAYQREKAEHEMARKTIIDLESSLKDAIEQRKIAESAPAKEYIKGRKEMVRDFEVFRRGLKQSADADAGHVRMRSELAAQEKFRIAKASEISMAAAYQRGRDDVRSEYCSWASTKDTTGKLVGMFELIFNRLSSVSSTKRNQTMGRSNTLPHGRVKQT